MRPQTYYALAALLVLATVPMYRYILAQARESAYSQSPVYQEHAPFSLPRTPLAAVNQRPLLAGEICKEGVVYLTDRNGYVPAKSSAGVIVHCRGNHLILANSATDERTWYAYNEKLPHGYKCSAADGPVYRTRTEKGAAVIEPLVRRGTIVRCGGDERSSYR